MAKHAGGRPTKYNADIQKKADNYLHNYKEYGSQIVPTISGLSIALDVRRNTLYEWAEKYPEFSNTLARIMENQQTALINKGLSGEFHATITKLMLANHGFHEKQDLNVDAKVNPIKIEFDDDSQN